MEFQSDEGLMSEKPTIFICYHQSDEKWKDDLVKQLNVLMQTFNVWTDREIEAGEDWLDKAEEAIADACVAIFLISSDSLSPQFILREDVKNLITRRSEGLRIIPLIVRDCGWEQVNWLARLKPRPEDGKPLRSKKAAVVETELKRIVGEVAEIMKRLASVTTPSVSECREEMQPKQRAAAFRPEPAPTSVSSDNVEARRTVRNWEEEAARNPELRQELDKYLDILANKYPQGHATSGSGQEKQSPRGSQFESQFSEVSGVQKKD